MLRIVCRGLSDESGFWKTIWISVRIDRGRCAGGGCQLGHRGTRWSPDGHVQAGDRPQDGRLAAARLADECEDAARGESEGHPVDRGRARAVGADEVAHGEQLAGRARSDTMELAGHARDRAELRRAQAARLVAGRDRRSDGWVVSHASTAYGSAGRNCRRAAPRRRAAVRRCPSAGARRRSWERNRSAPPSRGDAACRSTSADGPRSTISPPYMITTRSQIRPSSARSW